MSIIRECLIPKERFSERILAKFVLGCDLEEFERYRNSSGYLPSEIWNKILFHLASPMFKKPNKSIRRWLLDWLSSPLQQRYTPLYCTISTPVFMASALAALIAAGKADMACCIGDFSTFVSNDKINSMSDVLMGIVKSDDIISIRVCIAEWPSLFQEWRAIEYTPDQLISYEIPISTSFEEKDLRESECLRACVPAFGSVTIWGIPQITPWFGKLGPLPGCGPDLYIKINKRENSEVKVVVGYLDCRVIKEGREKWE